MGKKNIALLQYLITNEGPFSIRELSRICSLNYKSTYEIIAKLEKEGAIHVKKLANSKLCSFSRKLTPCVYLAEKKRQQEACTKEIQLICNELSTLQTPIIALLFGSYASKTHSKHSDIDILLISEKSEEIVGSISWIPKIHVTSISYDECFSMLDSKSFNVMQEAVKNNVILIGIEEYYRVLNAQNHTIPSRRSFKKDKESVR